jgi:hypothetical protein
MKATEEQNIKAGKLCVEVYMGIHVSQLEYVPMSVRRCWELGQKIRADTVNSAHLGPN